MSLNDGFGIVVAGALALASCSPLQSQTSRDEGASSHTRVLDSESEHKFDREWINAHLPKIMKEQEARFGIRYSGIPVIKFETPAWESSGMVYGGSYDSPTNTMYFPSGFSCYLDDMGFNACPADETTVAHELGHFYTDTLSERLGKGDWPDWEPGNIVSPREVGISLISEGIAEYFKREWNSGGDLFKDSMWPTECCDKFGSYIVKYQGGYHLVKPIVDKYGTRGIEWLMFHPPQEADLLHLPEYRQRVLEVLSTE